MRARPLLVALSLAALGGCADPSAVDSTLPGALPADIALVTLDLQQAPADAACIRLLVTQPSQGTREKLFSSTAGGRSNVVIGDLVAGSVTFSGQAFNVACASITSTTMAAYTADPIATTVTAGVQLPVTLTFRRPERALVGIDFPVPNLWATSLDSIRTTCAGFSDGMLRCRGADYYGNGGDGGRYGSAITAVRLDAKRIATAVYHTCAVTNGGELYCWGDNLQGVIGLPFVGPSIKGPTRVTSLWNVTDVAVSNSTSCAVADGGVYCWGISQGGSLGDGTTGSSYWPISAPIQDAAAVAVSPTGDGVFAITKTGALYAWGSDAYGQLGDGQTATVVTPKQIARLSNVTSVAVGSGFACAVASGQVYCWGRNDFGQCADGTTVSPVYTPKPVPILTNVTQVVAGNNHACAVQSTGTVRCWGKNDYGQIGDNFSVAVRTAPANVGYSGNAVELAAGENTACARYADGTVYCWGDNSSNQIDNAAGNRFYPVITAFQ